MLVKLLGTMAMIPPVLVGLQRQHGITRAIHSTEIAL